MRKYILALFCGLLFPLGFAPFDFWPLTILSLSIILYVINNVEVNKAFVIGILYGVGMWGLGISWVYVSIHYHGNQGIISSLLLTSAFVLFLSLYIGLAFLLFKTNEDTKIIIIIEAENKFILFFEKIRIMLPEIIRARMDTP